MSYIPQPRAQRLERRITISPQLLSPVDELKTLTPSKVIAMLPLGDDLAGKRRPFYTLEETRRGGRAKLRRNEDPIWKELE